MLTVTVSDLERQTLATSNEHPKPFVWTKSADQILRDDRSILSANL